MPDSKLSVVDCKPKPQKDIISLLEQILEWAKEGEIQGIAMAGVYASRAPFNCFIVDGYECEINTAVTLLHRDLIDCNFTLRIPPHDHPED